VILQTHLPHIKQIVHDGNPMGDSYPIGRLWSDQRIRNTMNTGDWPDLVGRPRWGSFSATAIPNTGRIALVMTDHLGKMSKRIQTHAADHDGQTGVKVFRRKNVVAIADSTFINPEDHVFKSRRPSELPATDGDGIVLAHFLRVRSPKSSSLG